MVLFCFDSYFHLTSIFLNCEIVDFCSEKSLNQIGIENQGVKSVNILNILYSMYSDTSWMFSHLIKRNESTWDSGLLDIR